MARQTKFSAGLIIRALRLPFTGAGLTGFIFGSLIEKSNFNIWNFLLGFAAVLSTHLSANLINDYADSKSGADWQDRNFFGFFGGSKLIQEGTLGESFYLGSARLFAFISAICVILLALNLKNINVIIYYAAILTLAWSYSYGPLAFSYRRMGEIIIFLLFGPALVMGGYFIQTGIFPDLKGLILSLPFGFFTAAILFANEVPDFPEDKLAGKFTWVNFTGRDKAYFLYCGLMCAGFFSIPASIALGFISSAALFSFILIFPAVKASMILRKHYSNKKALVEASKLTIAIQAIAGIILIAAVIL